MTKVVCFKENNCQTFSVYAGTVALEGIQRKGKGLFK